MPSHAHAQPPADDPEPPPGDELDAWYRAALAETMRPCPEYRSGEAHPDELTEHAQALARREQLATFFGDDPVHHGADRVRWSGAA